MEKIKAGIVGGTGYTGVELLRILAGHAHVDLEVITSRTEAGLQVAQMFPNLRGHVDLAFSAPDEARLKACDVVFFATPHGVAMKQAPSLVAAGVKVVDLAADFRLQNLEEFKQWYGLDHSCPDLLKEAVYGLPELNRAALKKARVVGNPGCYPTTVQLGLAPLLEKAWVHADRLIANCVSGVSGAGRKAEVHTLFSEASDNFKAYGVRGHRHGPEINQELRKRVQPGTAVNCLFVPHLAPMIRGMHATLYAPLTAEGQKADLADLQALYESFYQAERFVDVMPSGSTPETRSTRAANVLRIAVHRPQPDLAMILVVQDNLTKGAAGQAVQCMNVMFGLDESIGLTSVPVLP
jgi:N-acetyl-gamma-glutamyl-phosphate reductase